MLQIGLKTYQKMSIKPFFYRRRYETNFCL